MTEQWTGDWMRDAETGQLIDGPTITSLEKEISAARAKEPKP